MCLNVDTVSNVEAITFAYRLGKKSRERICPENSDDWVILLEKMVLKSHVLFRKSHSQFHDDPIIVTHTNYLYILDPLHSTLLSHSPCSSSPFTVLCTFTYLFCCLSCVLQCKPHNGRDFV